MIIVVCTSCNGMLCTICHHSNNQAFWHHCHHMYVLVGMHVTNKITAPLPKKFITKEFPIMGKVN